MSFDLRTRTADDVGPVDVARFHGIDAPDLLARHRDVVDRAWRSTGLEAFTLGVGDVVHTWQTGADGGVEVIVGDTGVGPRADLPPEWFSDLVNDVRSAVAVMIANEPVMARGKIFHLLKWEPVLRATIDGRPAWEPGAVTFVDATGAPLDLDRSFTLDDDPDEMRHFLAEAGFLHVRSVFTPDEMDDLQVEIERWRGQMTPDDNRAWYAKVGGDRVCVRVTNLGRDDVDFPHASRLAPIGALTGEDRRYAGSDLLVKPIGVEEGISDLPWHRDCELGMHSYRCQSLTCGVSVTASGPDNGQLGVIAGSHRVNVTILQHDEVDLPRVFLATERGDVTVHLSCALHCATPPVHSTRYVTYSSLVLPGMRDLDGILKTVRDQAGRDTYAPA